MDAIYALYNTNADSWAGVGHVMSYHRTVEGAMAALKDDTGSVDFLQMEREPSEYQPEVVRDFVYFQIVKIDLRD